ncbi:MAG: BspA family leucine-rich repeat surface protein, partial [Bacteroidota bacterium]
KRAKLITVDILFDKNTFDVGMYLHKPDLKSWLKRERNLGPGFEYYSLNRILTKKQANTSYLIHENFHGYQVPLLKGGKWFAEASADWAIWNYYREPLRGYAIAAFTLNPHMGIFEQFPGDSENYHRVVRFYHSSVILAYITSFLADESLIGRLYNEPFVERNAFITLANVLEEQGYDFDQEYGEFAARTAAWDYPNPQYSDDFERWERRGLVAGLPDHRFVDVFSEVGTYGIYQRVPGEFQPGAYGWNAYRIDSTAAGMYTVKLKGNEENPETTGFVAKIVKGTKGNYEYIDLPVSADIAHGNGEAQVEVEVSAGEQLFLVVTATDRRNTAGMRFAYEYAIGSSEHILPDDHIRNFVLEEETGFATIDHENFTVLSVVERGTDLSSLVPNVELSPGASSVPVTGDQVNFTDLVSYQVTGTGSAAKEWLVRVRAVPDRTDTDILSFELKDLVPFHTIDKENHTVSINLVNDVNLSSVEPIFTLSEGATSSPELGATIDLTSPVVYTITAEDGVTTQEWTISTKPFTPFITAWEVSTANESIPIVISEDSDYNFQYTWKNSAGSAVAEGVHTSADGDFVTSLPAAGSYTLEISGNYTHFRGYPRDNLTDILQWGDIPWTSMVRSFTGYQGAMFSATDVPDLSRVTSMFGVFEDAKNFNGDLSQWDVSSVENMDQAFEGAKVFNSDISGWDVSSLESAFRMFREAIAFNADISEWNTSNLRDMGQMFRSARSFNQNLGNWDMRKVTTIASGLGNLSPQNYDRTLIGWSTQNVREDVEVGAGGRKYCDADDARSFLINERSWTITGDTIACPEGGGTNILLFELADQSRPAKFNDDSLTVTIEVFGDVDQSTLQPVLTLSSGATSSPASEEVVDFSNSENIPVIYTVTASDGVTQQDWSVTVLKGASRPVVEEEIEDFVRNPESEEIIVIEEGTLAAYPNPTDDGTFTVDLDVYADKEEIAMGLFDSSGSAVPFRFSRDVSGRFLTINFNETEGIYYLHMKITMDEEWFEYEVIKVIKE